MTDDSKSRILLIESKEQRLEEILEKYFIQLHKLSEDTATQAAQIEHLEKNIEKLEEIVDTYRGKIDANCDFVNKHDSMFGCKITTLQNELAILKTTISMQQKSLNDTLSEPEQEQITISTTTTTPKIPKTDKKSIDSLSDTLVKLGAIVISLITFIAGLF